MKSNDTLEKQLQEFVKRGLLVSRTENNQYLKCSYKGSGSLISEKWNVKIYTSGSIVCNDFDTLTKIEKGIITGPDQGLKLLQIDDAGIGFPLLGVMVGVTNGTEVRTGTVSVQFFQGMNFTNKEYLNEYARTGLKVLESFGAKVGYHRIEICTGFINTALKEALRSLGFDVRVVEVKGLLQDRLEALFRAYVKETLKMDLSYDPKEMDKSKIGLKYYEVLQWGKQNAPHLLKTGWKSIQGN